MSYSLVRPRGKHKYWSVRIRLPGQATIERSTKCERKSDARAVAERLHTEAAIGSVRVPLIAAVGELIVLRTRQNRATATIGKIRAKTYQLLRFFGDDFDVLHMTLDDASRYVAQRRADGVTDSTIATEWREMTSALKRLRRREILPFEPNTRWPDELSHASGVRERWLPWPEYLKLLAALDPEFRDHFVIYCSMGLRFSELYRLRAVDLVQVTDGDGLLVRVRGTKTAGAARTVPANPDATEILQRRASAGGDLFPLSRKGGLPSQMTAWARALRAACRSAKVAHTSTNDLRRTFASRAFQEGVDEALVIKWMGHVSSDMVRRVYSRPSEEQHVREVAKLPSRRKAKS